MSDFNILTSNVPLGNDALATLNIFDSGEPDDVQTIRCVWKNHNSVTIIDQTWSGTDVSGVGVNGETATIKDVAGTGLYEARLFILNNGTWSPTDSGLTFSLAVTVTDQAAEGSGQKTETFTFKVVPSNLTISLDSAAVTKLIKRQAGLLSDIPYVSNYNETQTTIDTNPTVGYILSLGRSLIYSIEDAEKNGTNITQDTDYYWKTGRPFVTVATRPNLGDFFLFTVQSRLSNAALDDYVTTSTRHILSSLRPYYSDADILTYPTVVALVKDHALGRVKEDLAEGVALESAWYRSGRDMKEAVERILNEIKRGERAIVNSSGTVVARDDGTVIGRFKHADGVLDNLEELRSRLAKVSQIAINFYPFDPDAVTESR